MGTARSVSLARFKALPCQGRDHGFKFRTDRVTEQTLPCFKCGKPLESAIPDSQFSYNQPSEGTAFHSHGHYGSTAWDPVTGGKVLELNICDACLVEGKDRVLYVVEVRQVPQYTAVPWDPDLDV